eukprot:4481620-Prymnesium_polylepis.1
MHEVSSWADLKPSAEAVSETSETDECVHQYAHGPVCMTTAVATASVRSGDLLDTYCPNEANRSCKASCLGKGASCQCKRGGELVCTQLGFPSHA